MKLFENGKIKIVKTNSTFGRNRITLYRVWNLISDEFGREAWFFAGGACGKTYQDAYEYYLLNILNNESESLND